MIPKIRFCEFCDDWKQYKLQNIATGFEYGLAASAIEFDGTHKYIRITDIDDSSRKYIGNPIVSPDCVLSDKYLVKSHDILFARTGASTGKTYLFNDSDHPLYFAGFLIRINVQNANSDFIFYNTLTKNFIDWVRITSSRSGQPGINAEELKQYSLNIPSRIEQNKIATFLNLYYKKIELQKQKIESLKSILNFAIYSEFNMIKQQISLGSIAVLYQPQTITQNNFVDSGKYKVFGANGYIGMYNNYNHEQEQVVISCRGEKCSQVNIVEPYSWITGNSMVINLDNNNDVNKHFVYYALKSQNLKYLITGSGQPQIVRSDIINHKIPICEYSHQLKIVNTLENMNKKINLEKYKLELLEKYKQGLLQQMFI